MPTSMSSTKTKLKKGHVQQVRDVLDSYEFRDIQVSVSEKDADWILAIEDDHDPEWFPDWGDEEDPEMWKFPKALKRERLPNKEQFADKESWDKALDELFLKEHGDGLRALLGELADHIETPLVVLELYRDTDGLGQVSAGALVVQPGGKQVESVAVGL